MTFIIWCTRDSVTHAGNLEVSGARHCRRLGDLRGQRSTVDACAIDVGSGAAAATCHRDFPRACAIAWIGGSSDERAARHAAVALWQPSSRQHSDGNAQDFRRAFSDVELSTTNVNQNAAVQIVAPIRLLVSQ